MKRWCFFFLLFVLVGCATETPVQPDEQVHMVPTRTPTAKAQLPKPTVPVSPISPVSPPPPPGLPEGISPETLMKLRAAVAEASGVSAENLAFVSAEPVTWSNTSLGCPEKDKVYAEVLVEGWQIIFEDSSGLVYDIHTAGDLEDFVICTTSEAALDLDTADGTNMRQAKDAAIQALAEHLDVEKAQISVTSIEAVQWSNSCLDCADPDQMCAMVITPGYRVILESGGEIYPVHTDRDGQHVIVCEKETESP